MSPWRHNICQCCWNKREPNRQAVRMITGHQDVCCFCGEMNRHGIYVRLDPTDIALVCRGEHIEGYDEGR